MADYPGKMFAPDTFTTFGKALGVRPPGVFYGVLFTWEAVLCALCQKREFEQVKGEGSGIKLPCLFSKLQGGSRCRYFDIKTGLCRYQVNGLQVLLNDLLTQGLQVVFVFAS